MWLVFVTDWSRTQIDSSDSSDWGRQRCGFQLGQEVCSSWAGLPWVIHEHYHGACIGRVLIIELLFGLYRAAFDQWMLLLFALYRAAFDHWILLLFGLYRAAFDQWMLLLFGLYRAAFDHWILLLFGLYWVAFDYWILLLFTLYRAAFDHWIMLLFGLYRAAFDHRTLLLFLYKVKMFVAESIWELVW